MDKSVADPDKQLVPRFSNENALGGYLRGELDSLDFDDNFKLKSNLARTLLPYERQKRDFRPPLQPLLGSPADPPKFPPPPPPPPSAEVVARVLGAEIKALEAVIAAQAVVIAKRDIEIVRIGTTKRLLENLVSSFCAYYKHVNSHLFE